MNKMTIFAFLLIQMFVIGVCSYYEVMLINGKIKELDTTLQQTQSKITTIKQIQSKTKLLEKAKRYDNDVEVVKFAKLINYLQPKLDEELRLRIAKTVLIESNRQGLDPLLVISIIKQESNFRPIVQSHAGAVGLMQIRFSVWKEHAILKDNKIDTKTKLFWIDKNIRCGTMILKKYIEEAKDDVAVALNRYHTGANKIKKKAYEIKYVNEIMLRYYKLQRKWRALNDETHKTFGVEQKPFEKAKP